MSEETKHGFCKARDRWIREGQSNKGAPGCCRRLQSKTCIGHKCPAFEMRKPTRYLKKKLELEHFEYQLRKGGIL